MDDDIVQEYQRGVDAYWSGDLPDGWNNAELRANSPFLTGWWQASVWETQPGELVDEDGDPMQVV